MSHVHVAPHVAVVGTATSSSLHALTGAMTLRLRQGDRPFVLDCGCSIASDTDVGIDQRLQDPPRSSSAGAVGGPRGSEAGTRLPPTATASPAVSRPPPKSKSPPWPCPSLISRPRSAPRNDDRPLPDAPRTPIYAPLPLRQRRRAATPAGHQRATAFVQGRGQKRVGVGKRDRAWARAEGCRRGSGLKTAHANRGCCKVDITLA